MSRPPGPLGILTFAAVIASAVHDTAASPPKVIAATDATTASMAATGTLDIPARVARRGMLVGSAAAVVHAEASVSSRPLGVLRSGEAVMVVREGNFRLNPPTGSTGEYPGTESDAGGAREVVFPGWVMVRKATVQGWVPARSLCTPDGAGLEKPPQLAPVSRGDHAAADAVIERLRQPMRMTGSVEEFGASPRWTGLSEVGDRREPESRRDHVPSPTDALRILREMGVQGADNPRLQAMMEFTAAMQEAELQRITSAHERALGRECLARLLAGAKLLPEGDPVAAYVRWLGSRVAEHGSSPYPSIGLDFLVFESAESHAVAVPGGPVMVPTGLLKALQSETELAAVLAHAIAHVELRHGLQIAVDAGLFRSEALDRLAGRQQAIIEGQLAQLLPKEDAARVAANAVKSVVAPAMAASTDEAVRRVLTMAARPAGDGMEAAACLRGMALASAAGYDAASLPAVFRRLRAGAGDRCAAWFDGFAERACEDAARRLPPAGAAGPVNSGSDSRWESLRQQAP